MTTVIPLIPFVLAFLAGLSVAAAVIATERFHGHLSYDNQAGVQKLHQKPVPRVGGLALIIGQAAGGLALPSGTRELWWMICLSALPAFTSGLIEDLTKRVGVRLRLLATICSGAIFCTITGYYLTGAGVPGLDWILSFGWIAVPFTAVVIAGIANALNIIDGANGLASGTAIIVFAGLAVVAAQHGDEQMLALSLISIGALAAFFVINFPFGYIFLGDAGAYLTGMMLAVVAIMLPLRNPELSPLMGLLALSYPVSEMLVSIQRRVMRKGTHPGRADRLHLHSLIYRNRAKRLARSVGLPKLRNAMTAVMAWILPLTSVALMLPARTSTPATLVGITIVLALYLAIYRRLALLGVGGVTLRQKPT